MPRYLLIGEFVPKRLELLKPKKIARWVASLMHWLAPLAYPVVRLLGGSVDAVLRPLRPHVPSHRQPGFSL